MKAVVWERPDGTLRITYPNYRHMLPGESEDMFLDRIAMDFLAHCQRVEAQLNEQLAVGDLTQEEYEAIHARECACKRLRLDSDEIPRGRAARATRENWRVKDGKIKP